MKRKEKPLSLARMADTFEDLAEKFQGSAMLLAKENSFKSPRREVDLIYPIDAGTYLLRALDQGFLKSGDSSAWDLRAHKQRELWEMRCDIAERLDNLKRIRERAAKTSIYSHDRDEVFAELKKLERVPIESQQQMLDELQRNVESFLDPQSENWPLTAISSWQAFIRLVLIPQDASRFRMDWREHLPAELFVDFGDKVYHRLKSEQIAKPEKHRKNDDGRICHLVRARADIHATGCKIVAEMLRAEMALKLSEIGEPQQSGKHQKDTGKKSAADGAKQYPNKESSPSKPKRGDKLRAAFACLQQHPEWTDIRIAADVGCNPSNLSKNPQWRQARNALRRAAKSPSKRVRDARTGGSDFTKG